MKKIHSSFYISTLALLGMAAVFLFGCQKKETPAALNPTKPTTIVSAEKTSFDEVTSQLDPGGNFYLYLGTAQWLDGLSKTAAAWREKFISAPGIESDDLTNINKSFDVLIRVIQDSGIEDVSGVGMSSVEIEKGMYRDKMLIHHYPGKGSGFLWRLAGAQPHPLDGLDFLPANTALAIFSDTDLPLLWSVAQKEVNDSGVPKAKEWLQKIPTEFEKKTRVKWDQFLNSLGGECGLVLTLDTSNNVPVPLPPARLLQIPAPGLMLVLKVKDDTIFNRLSEELEKNKKVVAVNKPGIKMRTMPMPFPLPFPLRPTAASSGGYLFIASSEKLIEESLAVKNGQKAGLKSTADFKHLAQNIPDTGNQFAYVSRQFGQTIVQIQKQMMASAAQKQPAQAQWMQSFFQNRPAFTYSVSLETTNGYLTVANSSQSYANFALLPAVAVPGILAAIAIPNFVKARATAQRNACINNLRQIDAAKQQWALENQKKTNDVPTWDDLKPYLRGPVPLHCPAGGTYTINSIGQSPTCSIPGHELP